MILGALEAGGTKMVCAIGDELGNIQEQISLPTKTPAETIPQIVDFFRKHQVVALGIGSFGPIDLNCSSDTYGYILDTPKLAWRNYNFLGTMKELLQIPTGWDTDVNGSCLGEITYGSAKGLSSVLYLTVGTGIGAGICVEGRLLHGMLHPEAGHVLVKRHPKDDFSGACPYHSDCLEGMASGPAIEKRWEKKASEIKENELAWELEAYYLAQALTNYILTVSPQRIILGGGVMHQEHLFPKIRAMVKENIAGYLDTKELGDMDHYIVPASLKGNQGILGCIALAKKAYEQ